MNKIRVLLVDDHMVVRVGLTALINAEPDMEVVGEASNGAEGVDATVAQRPDVVVM
ncbi:MAG: response regulator, partial [Caldilinea sp.]|nr:response regulator [Caldilinea sp.]